MDFLARLRTYAVRFAAVVVVIINGTSTAESFMGLRAWATGHTIYGVGSYLFPGFIDTFPLLAEIALFVGVHDGWRWRVKLIPWVLITGGLVLSVSLQVGVVQSPDWTTRATHGMAPVAAWLSLVVGTLMYELIVNNKPEAEPVAEAEPATPAPEHDPEMEDEPQDEPDDEEELEDSDAGLVLDLDRARQVFADDISAGRVPGVNRIRMAMKPCGHDKADRYQVYLKGLVEAS